MGVWMLPKPAAEPQGVETANVPAEETRNAPAATGISSGIRLGRMGMELSDAGQGLQVTHPGRVRMLLPLTQRHPPLRVWRCGGWHDTSDPLVPLPLPQRPRGRRRLGGDAARLPGSRSPVIAECLLRCRFAMATPAWRAAASQHRLFRKVTAEGRGARRARPAPLRIHETGRGKGVTAPSRELMAPGDGAVPG